MTYFQRQESFKGEIWSLERGIEEKIVALEHWFYQWTGKYWTGENLQKIVPYVCVK